MALPSGFNELEQLQALVRRYINAEVRDHFRDLGDEFWEPEVGTTRGAMRHALTHKDNDTISVTLLRLFLYYFTYGQARQLQTPVYGIPTDLYQSESYRFVPQITLHFIEDFEDADEDYPRVKGEINFRIEGETYETITETKLTTFANRIKANFGANNGFIWRKGKVRCNYADKRRGYFLQILSKDTTAGKNIIERVLDIQNHTPDWKNLNVSENQEPAQAFPTIPQTERIVGKTRRLPRRRPIADVRFTKAEAHVYGLTQAVILYDRTRLYPKALAR